MISLTLILAGFFLPILGFFSLMLCPLPLCVLGCLEGQKKMTMAELMIEITLFLVVSPSMAVYFLLGCSPVAAIIYSISREDIKAVKKFSGPESILICTGASILFKLILIAAFWFFTGRNIFLPDIKQIAVILRQLYADRPELLQSVVQSLGLLPYLLPTLLVVYASFETLLNYSLCGKIVKKFSPSSKNFPPQLPEFRMWRFPRSLLLVLVCSFITGFFIDTDTWFSGAVFLMNLQIVINVFMFIQGLSAAFWLMDGFKLRRITKIFICLILTIPFFWAWLIIIGMSDMILNLRDRIKFHYS